MTCRTRWRTHNVQLHNVQDSAILGRQCSAEDPRHPKFAWCCSLRGAAIAAGATLCVRLVFLWLRMYNGTAVHCLNNTDLADLQGDLSQSHDHDWACVH